MTAPLTTLQKLVTAQDLADLQHLELVATRTVEGFLTGRHESKMKGGCNEFAEHRAYSPGDEIRSLDWRVLAKSDRYYVKEFHEESRLGVVLALDASGSMAYGESTRSKFLHARAAAACLARLVLGQGDPVALAIAKQNGTAFIPARSAPSHLPVLFDALLREQPTGRNDLLACLDRLIRQVRHRSEFILLTDAFVDVDSLERLLLTVSARGHRILLLHALAPEEVTFSFREPIRFQSLEDPGQFRDIDPAAFAETYLERMKTFIERLRKVCTRAGGEYIPLLTERSLGDTLGAYLRRRARREYRYGGVRER